MTNPAAEKQWRITAKIDTALCIGDSGTSESGVDRATVKTSDDKLYIPASTLKGIWRHACEAIARSQPHFVCNSPHAENMCPRTKKEFENENIEAMRDNHCTICQIFGSPTLESRIFINDLMIDADLETQLTAIRSGVSINRNRRVAEDHRLYFTETSLPNAGFEFSGDVTLGSKITDDQIKLLSAGLKYIHAIGSGKTRGLGWLSIEHKETTSDTQEVESIATDSETFTELSIKVTLESPIITGGRKPSGQAAETVQYIRGGLIRGAVANALLADLENSEPDDDFKQLFLNDGAGIFRNCYPGASVLPATAIGCKNFSGFRAVNDEENHGIFDTLFQRLVAEEASLLYHPNCPNCDDDDDDGRVEAKSGFYTQSKGCYKQKILNTRLLTRVAINRQRKVAADGLLYHLNAIDPLIVKGEKSKNVSLYGSARVPSALVSKVADTLQKQVQRLGGGSSRGLGRVSVKVKKRDDNDTDSLEQRISKFNRELKNVWETYSRLPNVDIEAFDGGYFSVDLQSGAILEQNWQSSMVITEQMLQETTGCNAEVKLIRSFANYDYVSGWNAAWKLPKETDLVTQMGSVFVFRATDIDAWIPALQTLESKGIGNRREEGFGQILICDRFHLRTREQVKKEEELK